MTTKWAVAVALSAGLLMGLGAFALSVEKGAEQALPYDPNPASEDLAKTESLIALMRNVCDAYPVPLCFEWPYVTDSGRVLDSPRKTSIQMRKDMSLSEALDAIVGQSQGMLRWERNKYGSICVLATGEGAKAENNLDVRIDLHVEKVTPWDAMRALVKAVNEKPVNGRRMGIIPGYLDGRIGLPSEMTEELCITLDLENVPARDALCAIIEQTPYRVAYWYYADVRVGESPPPARLNIFPLRTEGHKNPPVDVLLSEVAAYFAEYYEMIGDERRAKSERFHLQLCLEVEAEDAAERKAREEAAKEAQ